jgi:hypothetical protein
VIILKFAVVSSNRDNFKKYKETLQKYSLTIKIAYDEMCNDREDTCELYYIEINSLEELLKLKEEVNHKIIIKDYYCDSLYNCYEEPTIEIYDDWRE